MTLDGAERELFERSVAAAVQRDDPAAVDVALAELGWRDALELDARVAVAAVFELQGRAGTTSSALSQLCALALGHEPATPVVLPSVAASAPPLAADGAIAGVALPGAAGAAHLLVPGGSGAWLVPADALACRAVGGVDPWAALVEVTGALDPTAPAAVEFGWSAAVPVAQRALAHELVGACRRMLDLAREHALHRIQFGRPIATFQAIRHRLAEALIAIETAAALLDAAWLDPDPVASAMAKAGAGRAGRTVAKHCQQVLAGIGFTTEHPLHRFIRRTMVLDQLVGSSTSLTRSLGEQLVTDRRLPTLLPL